MPHLTGTAVDLDSEQYAEVLNSARWRIGSRTAAGSVILLAGLYNYLASLTDPFPMTRALLVIDVQREYFDGGLPISYPTGHLENILQIMDSARAANVATAVIRHHQADPQSPLFRKDSEMWQLHPDVESRPRDILIDKQLPGSFTGTGLEDWLRKVEADTVAIAGYMTHICCDTTARQAMHLGYKVEFLRDATGTLTIENEAGKAEAEELQRSILVSQQMFISQVISNDDWLNRIG